MKIKERALCIIFDSCRFFDKVIEKQFYGRAKPGSGRVSVAEGGGGGGATGLSTAQDRRRVLM